MEYLVGFMYDFDKKHFTFQLGTVNIYVLRNIYDCKVETCFQPYVFGYVPVRKSPSGKGKGIQ